ncbi:hypothetical protein KSP40_PGU019779 [Platanthera guangdongensis]|uniref:Uncharacterized protein n=1 Tax=Platanthera guangdongensis TaxID=2320717 RepID=A0ABR2M832_9ASPA
MSRAIGVAATSPSPPLLSLFVRASAGRSPAAELAPLAVVFRRRLLSSAGAASLVAVGAN